MLCVFVLLVLICESSRILYRKRRGEKKKAPHVDARSRVLCFAQQHRYQQSSSVQLRPFASGAIRPNLHGAQTHPQWKCKVERDQGKVVEKGITTDYYF